MFGGGRCTLTYVPQAPELLGPVARVKRKQLSKSQWQGTTSSPPQPPGLGGRGSYLPTTEEGVCKRQRPQGGLWQSPHHPKLGLEIRAFQRAFQS